MTEEVKLVSRNGIEIKLITDYFFLILAAFVFILTAQKANLIQTEWLAGEIGTHLILPALWVSLIAWGVSCILHNLVINLTKWDCNNSKMVLGSIFFVSFAAGWFIGGTVGLINGNTTWISALVIALFATIVHIRVSLLLSLNGVIVWSAALFVASEHGYALSINGGFIEIVLLAVITFMAQALFVQALTRFGTKQALKNFNKPLKVMKNTIGYTILIAFSFFFNSFIVLFVAQQLGYLEIIHFGQLLLVYAAYILTGATFHFTLSSVNTKTVKTTRTFSQTTQNNYNYR